VDRALLIELQAGDDVGPVGDAWEIVGALLGTDKIAR
jgi:hypothetical protein